jgi:molybdate transport system substrate-binding protein
LALPIDLSKAMCKVKKLFLFLLFSSLLSFALSECSAEEVNVAVTRAFLEVFQQIKPLFEAETGYTVKIISETSAVLYEKIKQGENIDLFLSADVNNPKRLIEEGLAIPDSFFIYAMGRLVLWTKSEKFYRLDENSLHSVESLALANPQTSPYGQAGQQILQAIGMWDKFAPNMKITRTLIESYQEIAQRKVDAGFILLSQYLSKLDNLGTVYWIVPQSYYQPLYQGAVILRSGEVSLGAQSLLEFLQCHRATRIINEFGFKVTKNLDD